MPPPSYQPTTDRDPCAQNISLAANMGANLVQDDLPPVSSSSTVLSNGTDSVDSFGSGGGLSFEGGVQHAQPGPRQGSEAADDHQSPSDDLPGLGVIILGSLRGADDITVALYAFALAVAIFSVTVEAVGESAPSKLCKSPGLALFYNALPTTCVTVLPGLLLILALASIEYTDDGGVTHAIRALFERPSRRYGLVFFCLAFTLITGPWGYRRADTALIHCSDYKLAGGT